ncbi:MAG: hypothetical protein ACLQU9_04530 [Acidimicrobiales bacterium]|jgi:hypothetical protein
MAIATIDWATIATFATAIGTLVLAVATFAAVRSANLSARVAERSFQVNLRPVLVSSRIDDPVQKIRWVDDHWARLEGNQAIMEFIDGSIYLAISVRNVGSGLAVTFGWSVMTEIVYADTPHADPGQFRMQTRDLYTAPGDIGFWQGAIRDASDPVYAALSKDISEARPFTIDVLYGDHEGGQHTITRFGIFPRGDGDATKWIPAVSRHWNLDRPDPR